MRKLICHFCGEAILPIDFLAQQVGANPCIYDDANDVNIYEDLPQYYKHIRCQYPMFETNNHIRNEFTRVK